MWVWIVVAAIFLFLLGRSLHESVSTTHSRFAGFLGALLDGLALLAMGLGVFGLLMALALGVFTGSGPRLAGDSLRDVLVWSGGLMAGALLLLAAGSGVRSLGGRAEPMHPRRGR